MSEVDFSFELIARDEKARLGTRPWLWSGKGVSFNAKIWPES